MIDTVLVANRGEIAVRIMRSARSLGYRTVAVYSPADADALHVAVADRAVALAGNESGASYLDIDQLINAARAGGADAVHPGYGFLAENAEFAQACIDAGLVWIGPPPQAIDAMGNKRRAKKLMDEAGVPTIPGSGDGVHDADELAAIALEIGLPVMIKAAAGGGGKGMRRVSAKAQLPEAIRSAAGEARSSFGNAELIVEKALTAARHVEVQVFADCHGSVVHLGERDCSMQRRHQKIIEECPSPAVDLELRERMGQAAVDAARAIGYVGAGTVEFMLDAGGDFYFLEMNTRLQVEHPVTELVTGLDLVAWQLRIAAGESLPAVQNAISWSGHAIEARLFAEAPGRDFMPQSGRLLCWRVPSGDGVRTDSGVREGQEITPHYDPLIAKIIAHGADRESARRRLLRALEHTVALGVVTNRAYLIRALEQPAFIEGAVDTGFVEQHGEALSTPASDASRLAVAAALLAGARPGADNWRRAGLTRGLKMQVDDGGEATEVPCRVRAVAGGWQVDVGDRQCRIELSEINQGPDGDADRHLGYRLDGVLRRVTVVRHGATLWLADEYGDLEVSDNTLAASTGYDAIGHGRISAPMDGSVIEVVVGVGDTVVRGQTLAVMEAMKMETSLCADIDGIVTEMSVTRGDQLKKGQPVAVIESSDDAGRSRDDAG